MDIWSWIGELADAGGAQGYLAYRAGWVLPGHVVGGEHDQVDAIAPGLLAEARAQGLPWLEVPSSVTGTSTAASSTAARAARP